MTPGILRSELLVFRSPSFSEPSNALGDMIALNEGDRIMDGSKDVFIVLTLCERARDALVGVKSLEVARGMPVCASIGRGPRGVMGLFSAGLLSLDTGRVAEASSFSCRFTRFEDPEASW